MTRKGTVSSKKTMMLIAGLIVLVGIVMILGAQYVSPLFGYVGVMEPKYVQAELVDYIMSAAYSPGDFFMAKKMTSSMNITLTANSVLVEPGNEIYTTPPETYFIVPSHITVVPTKISLGAVTNNTLVVQKIGDEITMEMLK